MSEEEIKIEINNLSSYSEDIGILYSDLFHAEINGDKDMYIKIYKKLKTKLKEEQQKYKKLNLQETVGILSIIDDGCVYDSLSDINDKFIILPLLKLDFAINADLRLKLLVKENYLAKEGISKFIESSRIVYHSIEEKEFLKQRNINTYLVENRLFDDLLEIFICNLNVYINLVISSEIKTKLINYKYALVEVFGKTNLNLLRSDKDFDNTYLYSKLLYDIFDKTESGLIYNYRIIRNDYLSKNLYNFLILRRKSKNNLPNQAIIEKILDVIYVDSINLLLQEDKKIAYDLYNETKGKYHNKDYLEASFNDDKKIKLLTLNK